MKPLFVFLVMVCFNCSAQSNKNIDEIKEQVIKVKKLTGLKRDKRPLLILDGSPDIDSAVVFNPESIASIQFLSKPAAKGIYANRGLNGAILVTSKYYYIAHVENELSLKFKTYRKLVRQTNAITYAVSGLVLKGSDYEVAKHIYNLPEKDIKKLNIKNNTIHKDKHVLVDIITKK